MTHFTWTLDPICINSSIGPLSWYSFFVYFGWVFSFLSFNYQEKDSSLSIQLLFFSLFLIGSRIGFFLQTLLSSSPISLFDLREGGLAGQVGGMTALIGLSLFHFLSITPELSLLRLFDSISVASLPSIVLARLGNFFNHEGLGLPTTRCLGVIFIHAEGTQRFFPVHPVQLYEAIGDLLVYLLVLSTTDKKNLPGTFFSKICFGFGSVRLIVEFFKPQHEKGIPSFGKILSLPFIVCGFTLLLFLTLAEKKRKKNREKLDQAEELLVKKNDHSHPPPVDESILNDGAQQ